MGPTRIEPLVLVLSVCSACTVALPAPRSSSPADLRGERVPDARARETIPGSGLSLVPPPGATRMRFGAGWEGAGGELDLFIALSEDPTTVADFDTFGTDGEPIATEDVVVDGRRVRLTVDRSVEMGDEIERVWLVAHEGPRGLAVLGEYASARSTSLRPVMRASLLSLEWDAAVAIDPERAAGYQLAGVAELVPVPEVVNGITYAAPGFRGPIDTGEPVILVVPLGVEVPPGDRARDCEGLLFTAGPLPIETVVEHAPFAEQAIEGCEAFGREAVPTSSETTLSLATYAAIAFLDDEAFLVAGVTRADRAEPWTGRFMRAARNVAAVAR